MRRFAFPLARVQAVRQTQADIERAHLERLLAARHALAQQRDQLAAEAAHSARQLAQPGATSSAGALQNLENFQSYARQEDLRLAQALQAATADVHAQQQRVRAAEQRCRLLEKLEAHHRAHWQQAAAKELDEIAADAFLAQWPKRKA